MATDVATYRVWQGSTQTQREGLARSLRKHHITGIAISGTVGAGLFITSGQIIGIAGSLGAVISYAAAGAMVMCVMLCLSEMISVRPLSGALFEFPALYVHESLGFATGWAYWLAYTCSSCTLTVEAAMLLEYWKPELTKSVAILICWLPIIAFNFFGPVLWYGWLEWGVKWLKLLLILGVSIVMICIAAGLSGNGTYSIQTPSHQWDNYHRFPPGFSFSGSWENYPQKGDIEGHLGAFLGVWTSITTAFFAYIGVEIVVIAAGEAKFPRHDLPIACRWIYWFAIFIYVMLALLASLNVPYDDPALLPYSAPRSVPVPPSTLQDFPDAGTTELTTGDRSPFVIAIKRAGIDHRLSGFLNGCLFFAAATAANTAYYVSSRTLYALCSGGKIHPRIRRTFGSTSYVGLPLWAIFTTICISACAFIGTVEGVQNEIIGVVSRISVTAILCVYVSECVAFIRYQQFFNRRYRKDRKYKEIPGFERCYRSGLHQPFPAVTAITFGSLLVLFSGWDVIYRASRNEIGSSQIVAGIFGSYFSPVLFMALFMGHRLRHGSGLRNYNQVLSSFDSLPEDDKTKEPLQRRRKWVQVILEMR